MAAGCALALGLAFAPTANAAEVTVQNLGAPGAPIPLLTIAMRPAATTLTLSKDGSGAYRIHEDGDALTPPDPANVGGCSMDGADVVCTANNFLRWEVSNVADTVTPLLRDVVIAKSATHADATGFFDDVELRVTTQALMEAWLPDGAITPAFTGSGAAGPAGQPADIVHVGSAGLGSPTVPGGMGGGDDLLIGSIGAIIASGGNGADTLIGSSASDTLDGGGDNDLVRGGLGGDVLRGAGGDDSLIGNAGADSLDGGDGDDILDGGGGLDTYAAGDGADDVRAADGVAEIVDCGLGIDVAIAADADDTLSGCEGPQAAGAGGGLPAPPVVTTGLAAGSAVGPAQGVAPAAAAAAPPVIGATLTTAFRVRGSSTIVTALTARNLPANSNVTISCAAPKGTKSRCPIKSTSRGFAKATASSPLAGLFKKSRLPANTVIVVRISAPGVRGRRITLTTRKGLAPKRTTGCVAPGSTTPASCAAA
jgi:hypothetical protein